MRRAPCVKNIKKSIEFQESLSLFLFLSPRDCVTDTLTSHQNVVKQDLKNSGKLSCLSGLNIGLKIKVHKNRILPVAVYGFGTWSLTLSKEYTLKA
jgi:hypothetical protein